MALVSNPPEPGALFCAVDDVNLPVVMKLCHERDQLDYRDWLALEPKMSGYTPLMLAAVQAGNRVSVATLVCRQFASGERRNRMYTGRG